jgi:hypothetical protein
MDQKLCNNNILRPVFHKPNLSMQERVFFPSAVNEMTFFMFLYLGYPSTKYCSNTSKDKENQKQTAQGNHQGDISFFSELKNALYL